MLFVMLSMTSSRCCGPHASNRHDARPASVPCVNVWSCMSGGSFFHERERDDVACLGHGDTPVLGLEKL
jgi:hypothetical protein